VSLPVFWARTGADLKSDGNLSRLGAQGRCGGRPCLPKICGPGDQGRRDRRKGQRRGRNNRRSSASISCGH